MSDETRPRLHHLKTWIDPFDALWRRDKRHEVRRDDRGYRVGDLLLLREWHETEKRYTGRGIRVRITYMSAGGTWGLPAKLCVMSIEELGRHG